MKKITFKKVYLVILILLLILAMIAVFYVMSLLRRYESTQPEKIVEATIEDMKDLAKKGQLWSSYSKPDSSDQSLRFENKDLAQYYSDQFASGEVSYKVKPGAVNENSSVYSVVTKDGDPLAEITLNAVGEPETKLIIFPFQDWKLGKVNMVAEPSTYTVIVPGDFKVIVNGVEADRSLATLQENGTYKYEISGLYLKPDVEIISDDGTPAKFNQSGKTIAAEFYDYSLTLPSTLTVTLNGEEHTGTVVGNGTVLHEIKTNKKPEVTISDVFGNTVTYEGGNELDLTYGTLKAYDSYSVTVDGLAVPESVTAAATDSDLAEVALYAEGVPGVREYNISILKKDAEIKVTDEAGNQIPADLTTHSCDLTSLKTGLPVPDAIAAEINVLNVAETWSLFMSADLDGWAYGFWTVAQQLVDGSNLYNFEQQWVNGIDITFISYHTLNTPPFANEVVTNYRAYGDNAFSVDISFDKDIHVTGGDTIADGINSTFYFIKEFNNWGTYTWKLIQIKEIIG